MDNRKKFRKSKTLDCYSGLESTTSTAPDEISTSLRNIVLNKRSFSIDIAGPPKTINKTPKAEQIEISIEEQQPPINMSSTRHHAQSPGIEWTATESHLPPLSSLIGESLTIARPPTPVPLAIVCAQTPVVVGQQYGSSRNSPKTGGVGVALHDKENESPIAGELLPLTNSPKKKQLNENVLAEQNSPRIMDMATTRFSFSPKQLNRWNSGGAAVARPGTPTPSTTALQNTINSSPLLSSAVYKHGNYFKFPEVDCFTPDKPMNYSCCATAQLASIQTGPILSTTSAIGKLTVIGNQAARRARLKSISLDSEGARLVEDNLGIPVEELMEMANQSPPELDECFQEENENTHYKQQQNDMEISNIELRPPPPTPTDNKLNRLKNKNNLTINIETEEPHSINKNNNKTPKTPTLNQTKQKAVSLDSSSSTATNLYGCLQPLLSSSLTVGHQHHHHYQHQHQRLTPTSKSLLHVSSVPSTPKRNQTNRKKLLKKTMHQFQTLHQSGQSSSTGEESIEIIGYDDSDADDDNNDDDEIGENAIVVEEEELSGDEVVTTVDQQSNLLGTNLQNQKSNALSLSNNNLKTLPEVMTLSDFRTPAHHHSHQQQQQQLDDTRPKTTARSNILQRRGSNHSLTLNLNSSCGNLTKGLSVSNYSLGSYNGSNYNLSHPTQHQQIVNQPSITSSTQSIAARGSSSSQTNILLPRSILQQQQQQQQSTNPVAETIAANSKKNLLQRRGSNTSLTLNIQGSSSANLSRFNSHSSLNIVASTQSHLHQSLSQNKLKHQQHQLQHQLGLGLGSKRGLLERRNSNASLTLNVQGLSISNCNLRGSACSLSSILNPDFKNSDPSTINTEATDLNATSNSRRKFLSSENLNSVPQCTKLNQTHARNSTKTCFGSVSDLKPPNELTGPSSHVGGDVARPDQFEQTALCSCTGVRNITTKPLSPQSTSEDFKMYLANVQLLQNATNILNDEHLRKLHFVFERSYQAKPDCGELQPYGRKSVAVSSQHFNFYVSPSDDEQKHLVRTLYEEFWDLPTNHQEKPLVFGSQAKNRYKTILPNEHSRVMLDQEAGSLLEVYINANYIKGPEYTQNSYIATQGPLPNTIYDFWIMVHQNIGKCEEQQPEDQRAKPVYDLRKEKMDETAYGEIKVTTTTKTTKTTPKLRSNKKLKHDLQPLQLSGPRRISTIDRKCQKIVMLTNFIENNQQKCSIYFPIIDNQTIFVTARNERFENEELARFYAKYLNWKNGNDSQQFEIEIEMSGGDSGGGEIVGGSNSSLEKTKIPCMNYFVLKNAGIVTKDSGGFSIRKIIGLYVTTERRNDSNGSTRSVQLLHRFVAYHYWFPDWPDHRSPADINVLLDLSLHLLDSPCRGEFMKFDPIPHDYDESILEAIIRPESNDNNGSDQPFPIIHCSAGIGRTGCLAAILNGIRQIRGSIRTVLKPWNYELTVQALDEIQIRKNYVAVDVLGIVCNLRLQRGGMVQNSEQYELIHRALCLYQARIDDELMAWDRKIIVQGMDDQSDESDDGDGDDDDDDEDDDDADDDELDQTTII